MRAVSWSRCSHRGCVPDVSREHPWTAPDATAFELRAPHAVHLAFGMEWDEPERTESCTAWLDGTWRQLLPFSGGRVFTNYASVEGDAARAAYGGNHRRLVSLKQKYDPDNVFRGNLNIRP